MSHVIITNLHLDLQLDENGFWTCHNSNARKLSFPKIVIIEKDISYWEKYTFLKMVDVCHMYKNEISIL